MSTIKRKLFCNKMIRQGLLTQINRTKSINWMPTLTKTALSQLITKISITIFLTEGAARTWIDKKRLGFQIYYKKTSIAPSPTAASILQDCKMFTTQL